jgi:hypothetical protein
MLLLQSQKPQQNSSPQQVKETHYANRNPDVAYHSNTLGHPEQPSKTMTGPTTQFDVVRIIKGVIEQLMTRLLQSPACQAELVQMGTSKRSSKHASTTCCLRNVCTEHCSPLSNPNCKGAAVLVTYFRVTDPTCIRAGIKKRCHPGCCPIHNTSTTTRIDSLHRSNQNWTVFGTFGSRAYEE